MLPETKMELKIASPCPASWEQMSGDNRARHCAQCNLNVYNFSEMTSAEIELLLAASAGQRFCGRLYQRPDGTILTRDCPVGLRARIRRVSRRLTAALGAAMGLVFAAQGCSQQAAPLQGKLQTPQPGMPQQGSAVMGDIALPAPTGFNLAVVDPSGNPIPHAQVSLLDHKTGTSTALGVTDQAGKFSWSRATDGNYTIIVQTKGFVRQSQRVSIKPPNAKPHRRIAHRRGRSWGLHHWNHRIAGPSESVAQVGATR